MAFWIDQDQINSILAIVRTETSASLDVLVSSDKVDNAYTAAEDYLTRNETVNGAVIAFYPNSSVFSVAVTSSVQSVLEPEFLAGVLNAMQHLVNSGLYTLAADSAIQSLRSVLSGYFPVSTGQQFGTIPPTLPIIHFVTNESIAHDANIASTKFAAWGTHRDAGGYKLYGLSEPEGSRDAATRTTVDILRDYVTGTVARRDLFELSVVMDISAYQPVTITGSVADSGSISHFNKVIGLALEDISAGQTGLVLTQGVIQNTAWSWTSGTNVFLNGTNLSHTPVDSSGSYTGFSQKMGLSRTDVIMYVDLNPPVLL